MDLVKFQEFLAQLISLQAAGLDAQHLIDEAKAAGKEEALKEIPPVAAPVEGEESGPVAEVPAVDMEALKAELEAAKAEKDKALADDASDKEKIESLSAKVASYEQSFENIKALIPQFAA